MSAGETDTDDVRVMRDVPIRVVEWIGQPILLVALGAVAVLVPPGPFRAPWLLVPLVLAASWQTFTGLQVYRLMTGHAIRCHRLAISVALAALGVAGVLSILPAGLVVMAIVGHRLATDLPLAKIVGSRRSPRWWNAVSVGLGVAALVLWVARPIALATGHGSAAVLIWALIGLLAESAALVTGAARRMRSAAADLL
ncbi:hypothetical protein KNO15_05340 [Leifsonia shinshuensis]|uniref:hypothetical protein n=1 Tax=Leifsonia shinshuensis TaxID=150026 RepID=UPI001F50A269|nr:hypothetical protein [Leifsonia shinshuensis]MCI0156118.1 hypothetical protein [Leifsonia shinshuensis]